MTDDIHFAMWPEKVPSKIFEKIAADLSGDPHSLPVGSLALLYSYESRHAVVAMAKNDQAYEPMNTILGYARLSLLTGYCPSGIWAELGSVWVRKGGSRAVGAEEDNLQTRMCKHLIEKYDESINILASTTNLDFLGVCKRLLLTEVPRKRLPEVVWKSSCQCPLSRTKASRTDQSDCALALGEPHHLSELGECRFAVTPQTAERFYAELFW